MIRLALEKEKFYSFVESKKDMRGLERLARMKFDTLSQLRKKLERYNCYVNTDLCVAEGFIPIKVTKLPFVLKELPIFYSDPHIFLNEGMYIGNAKAD